MNKAVQVSVSNCLRLAELVRSLRFKSEIYHRPFLTLEAPEEVRFRTYFYAVAICHQTHTLQSKVKNLWGWDYIEETFTRLAVDESPILWPGFLAASKPEEVIRQLAELFSDTGQLEDTTFDRLNERVKLITDADILLQLDYNGSLTQLFDQTPQVLAGQNGLYAMLEVFEAYCDPLRKKSSFLLKLLEEAKLIQIEDPDNYVPIMDYHMQRVLLRIGCVEITQATLAEKLRKRIPVSSDLAIRKQCIEAFSIIAHHSGINKVKLNDIFWSLGRSCCHEHLLCRVGYCEKNPCTLTRFVDLPIHNHCPFDRICKGAESGYYRSLWQPLVETHYY